MSSKLGVQNIAHTNGTNAMTISSGGIVIPKGVIMQVNAIDTDQNFTASGGFAKIEWETVEIDTISGWDSTNHRYTPNVAGYYLVGGAVRILLSNILSLVTLAVRKNGSNSADTHLRNQFQSNSDAYSNGSYAIPTGLMQMNGSSDYMEVFFDGDENAVFHDSPDIKSFFFAQLVHAT